MFENTENTFGVEIPDIQIALATGIILPCGASSNFMFEKVFILSTICT